MWKETESHLVRNFEFTDFIHAWSFMTHVALVAEKMNHHPEWKNTYNKVEIKLSTHDAENAVTAKDRKLAVEIDRIFGLN